MAQSVERRIGSAEVTGSIPVASFSNLDFSRFFILENEQNKEKEKLQKVADNLQQTLED